MSKYQLPCTCGAIIPVSLAQAGASLPCPMCGVSVSVPGTKALRNLTPVPTESEAGRVRTKSESSGASNTLRKLAAFFLLAGIGLLTSGAYLLYERLGSGIDFTFTEEQEIIQPTKADTLEDPPAAIWDKYKLMIDSGFPKSEPLPYFAIQRYLEQCKPWMIGCFVSGTVSLLLFAIICVLLSKSSKPRLKSA